MNINFDTLNLLSVINGLRTPPLRYDTNKQKEYFSVVSRKLGFSDYLEIPTGFELKSKGNRDIQKIKVTSDNLTMVCDLPEKMQFGLIKKNFEFLIKEFFNILTPPFFLFQTCVIRKTVTTYDGSDIRKFLAEKVCRIEENKLQPFGRPVHTIGVRFLFPPFKDNKTEFNIKVESLARNTKYLFIENSANFFYTIRKENIKNILENLNVTEEFIDENIKTFLSQFK